MIPSQTRILKDSPNTNALVIDRGGFAGIKTILALRQSKPRPPIILIEQHLKFIFSTLLYEPSSEELQKWEIAPNHGDLLRKKYSFFIEDKVFKIDLKSKTICTSLKTTVKFPQLVLRTGSKIKIMSLQTLKTIQHFLKKYYGIRK